jgi:rhodanese-related sulfurtransferase
MDHGPRFLELCDDVRTRVAEVSTDDVAARLARGEDFALIDVREESEFAAGRIKGARHLGKGVLERDVEAAISDPNAAIVLYCGGGFRSVLAAENLMRMGYANVTSMAGGFREWKAKALPME